MWWYYYESALLINIRVLVTGSGIWSDKCIVFDPLQEQPIVTSGLPHSILQLPPRWERE